jgi:hypothetical protein
MRTPPSTGPLGFNKAQQRRQRAIGGVQPTISRGTQQSQPLASRGMGARLAGQMHQLGGAQGYRAPGMGAAMGGGLGAMLGRFGFGGLMGGYGGYGGGMGRGLAMMGNMGMRPQTPWGYGNRMVSPMQQQRMMQHPAITGRF